MCSLQNEKGREVFSVLIVVCKCFKVSEIVVSFDFDPDETYVCKRNVGKKIKMTLK